ncbi:hypothetical protein Cgig2_009373 [Carnegiea gigantea]|uniref:Uncharacterized protein n=1 Tax=Carnegiea gigantea TaxID=171969 RepID=A0A9Q1Q8B7_9CARY|nr:hypothetical protein Cgig2_009373 [Carnegiea gigantea]
MEDLPVNLDDGELWLPSDIFPPEEPCHPVPTGETRFGDLGHQFDTFNLLDHHRPIHTSKAPSISQGLEVPGPMRQYALTAPSTNGCYGVKVDPAVDHGLRTCDSEYDYEYSNLIPAPSCQPVRYPTHKRRLHHQVAEAEQLMETGIGSLRRVQQNRHQNRLFPFQGTVFSFSLMKDCRAGTGVFIPRATASHKVTSYDGGERKRGVTSEREAGRKTGMSNAEEYYSFDPQVPPDVGLPKDWTY